MSDIAFRDYLGDIRFRDRLGLVCEALDAAMGIRLADRDSFQAVSGRRVVRETYATTHMIAGKLTGLTWEKLK